MDNASSKDLFLIRFLRQESAAGILLVITEILAIILANSPVYLLYQLLIDTPVWVEVGKLEIAHELLSWVNDVLMAVFGFLVGLELKREFLEGELSKLSAGI